jgi:uncharacterized protein
MKIVIISDIHDNLINLRKCLKWCVNNNVDALVCCGDVTKYETLTVMFEEFAGPLHLVRGNVELYTEDEVQAEQDHPNLIYYGKVGRFEVDGVFIGLCHEPFLIDKVLESGSCDFVFYGHTHKPWIEKKYNTAIANPGTLGGVFQKATFAVLDSENDNLELKLLENE